MNSQMLIADVVNIRMQANIGGKNPDANYKHALDGLYRIARSEGITQLWRGVGCVLRCV